MTHYPEYESVTICEIYSGLHTGGEFLTVNGVTLDDRRDLTHETKAQIGLYAHLGQDG